MLQLSAGQGPAECSLGVKLALKQLLKEASEKNLTTTILESQEGMVTGSLKSVVVTVEGSGSHQLISNWQGSIQWICKSPLRPRHSRKNWFIGCTVFEEEKIVQDDDVCFKFCRASGAGGQHVNKTNSAVQATHLSTGVSVRIQSERSQHANKRLAKLLLAHKLSLQAKSIEDKSTQAKWAAHWQLERGNPTRTFKGERFKEV